MTPLTENRVRELLAMHAFALGMELDAAEPVTAEQVSALARVLRRDGDGEQARELERMAAGVERL